MVDRGLHRKREFYGVTVGPSFPEHRKHDPLFPGLYLPIAERVFIKRNGGIIGRGKQWERGEPFAIHLGFLILLLLRRMRGSYGCSVTTKTQTRSSLGIQFQNSSY